MRLDDCTSAVPQIASIGTAIRRVAVCQKQSEQVQQKTRLFDHLVGGYKQGLGHCEV